jgi:hypothetical protein
MTTNNQYHKTEGTSKMATLSKTPSGPKIENLDGKIFGRLTVIGREKSGKHFKTRWLCKCICGNQKVISAQSLKNGTTTSCGCYKLERISEANRKKPFQFIYNNMVSNNKNRRRIVITYEEYLTFVGRKCHYCHGYINWQPYTSKINKSVAYFLDRKNNDTDYTIENCVPCCMLCNRCKNTLPYDIFYRSKMIDRMCNDIKNGCDYKKDWLTLHKFLMENVPTKEDYDTNRKVG